MKNILELSREEKLQLAQNPNTSTETLAVLATDKDYLVRFWVALNSNTSTETLSILATDENYWVRRWVVKHPNATEMIRRLVLMTDAELSTAAH